MPVVSPTTTTPNPRGRRGTRSTSAPATPATNPPPAATTTPTATPDGNSATADPTPPEATPSVSRASDAANNDTQDGTAAQSLKEHGRATLAELVADVQATYQALHQGNTATIKVFLHSPEQKVIAVVAADATSSGLPILHVGCAFIFALDPN